MGLSMASSWNTVRKKQFSLLATWKRPVGSTALFTRFLGKVKSIAGKSRSKPSMTFGGEKIGCSHCSVEVGLAQVRRLKQACLPKRGWLTQKHASLSWMQIHGWRGQNLQFPKPNSK